MRTFFFRALVLAATLFPAPLFAFDYLEHSYFADKSCEEAMTVLAKRIHSGTAGESERTRYLALAIVCPNTMDLPYCADEDKKAEANISRLPEGGEHALTFGDYAALADHMSSFGPVRKLPPPVEEQDGLLTTVFEFMAAPTEDVEGIIGDVAENACESEEVDWKRVRKDIQPFVRTILEQGITPSIPEASMSPLVRSPIQRGPHDPAGVYSFDNPHFLDLVLNDRNHFSDRAFTTWLGFHSTAVDIANRPCENVLGLDADALENLEETAERDERDWDSLGDSERNAQGCKLLGEIAAKRLQEWSTRGNPQLTAVVTNELSMIRLGGAKADTLLSRTVSATMALVMEGIGIHYLQDSLSAGHLRTPNSLRMLEDRRFAHDFDNSHGLSALTPTAKGTIRWVAFGDSYLLGPTQTAEPRCFAMADLGENETTDCLLAFQRGLVTAAGAASLTEWVLGGPLYRDQNDFCESADEAARLICTSLPTGATRTPGTQLVARDRAPYLLPTALPVPPPAFRYQSFGLTAAMDVAGSGNQIGLDTGFYSTLGTKAGWLGSHHLGIRLKDDTPLRRQFALDYAYGFHWRWSARFLLDMEPFVYAGFQGYRDDRMFMMGIGPHVGFTALPEGWVKLPLSLSVAYRLPLRMFTSDDGFFGKAFSVEAHWLAIALGLAFM